MASPLLTVAIPTLNRAALLKRAVESALHQTRDDVEVFVSNNGSTDDTRVYLDGLSDPRLRVEHRDRTIPAMAHGRYVTEQVRTPYAVFLSDDDFLEPEFAERTLGMYERDESLAFVHTRVRLVQGAGATLSPPQPEVEEGWQLLLRFLEGGYGPAHCATVYRSAHARDLVAGVPDDVLLGDLFLWPTLAPRGRVGYVAAPLSNYTWNGANMSAGIPLEVWLRDVRMAREQWEGEARRARLPAPVLERLADAAAHFGTARAMSQLWLRAISGEEKGRLARQLLQHRRLLLEQPARALTRAAAMLALPASVLRRISNLRRTGFA